MVIRDDHYLHSHYRKTIAAPKSIKWTNASHSRELSRESSNYSNITHISPRVFEAESVLLVQDDENPGKRGSWRHQAHRRFWLSQIPTPPALRSVRSCRIREMTYVGELIQQ